MTGTTTNFAIPYPSVTDYVTNGATDMRLLAEKVDAVMSSGTPARNLLINGAMQVAQRSSSVAGITAANYYTADRYATTINTLGTWTQSIENDAPTGSGFRKSLKMLCTTADASPAAGDYLIIQQALEGQDLQAIRKGTSSAQTLTLSFWVKSFQTGTFIVQLEDSDNNRRVSASYTVSVSGTWEYKTVLFPADTTGALDNDNAKSFAVNWWLGAGSNFTGGTLATAWASAVPANYAVGQVNVAGATNNYWQMTGAQLTVGSVSVPFEFKSFADDLRDCQRYYYKTQSSSNGVIAWSGSGFGYSTVEALFTVGLPVTMRVAPTSVDVASMRMTDLNNVYTIFVLSIATNRTSVDALALLATSSGMTVYRPLTLEANATTAGYVAANAEL